MWFYDPYEATWLLEQRTARATRERLAADARAGASRRARARGRRALLALRVLVDGAFALRVAEALAARADAPVDGCDGAEA